MNAEPMNAEPMNAEPMNGNAVRAVRAVRGVV